MANNFQIVISAVDKTTAVVNKINQRIGAATKPIGQVQAAVGRLGKEMGFDNLGRSMVQVGRAAQDVAGKITSIAAPIAAVAGVGSIAAVAALALEWGKLGAEVSRTSATIGTSTGELQSLRGAAQLSGVPIEALTGGLKSLGDTMEDALYGRNQPALAMMSRLGIQLRTTADGAVDSSAAFMDLAEQISKIKSPQVQGLVARTFGLEAALPLLRRGRDGVAELQAQVQATGAVMGPQALAAAVQFQKSMGLLDLSVTGLRNSIGAQLLPVVTPLVDQLSAWISANRDLVATKVGEFASGVAKAIEEIDWQGVVHGAKDFAAGIESVVDWMGGWKNAAIAVGVVMAGPLITSVFNLATAMLRLGVTAVPVAIRAFGLLAVAADATLMPALVGGALKAGVLTEGLANMASGVPIVGSVLQGLSGAFVAVGAAIEATPVGWILTGIAAIGVAGYELYEHWSEIGKWWHKLWGDIGNDVSRNSEKVKNASGALTGAVTAGGRGSPMIEAAARRKAERQNAAAANGVRTVAAAGGAEPIGIRQNNPGNLRSWGDAAVANGYAQFPTAIAGLSAMAGNLQAYGRHGWNDIDSIADHWAPKGDGNNVEAYKASLVKSTGFGLKDRLDLNDPKTLQALIPAITKQENGRNPYDAGVIAQAISSRLGVPVGVGSAAPAVETPSSVSTGAPVPTPYMAQNAARIAAANSANAGSSPSAVSVPGGAVGTIRVEIDLGNLPKGSTAKVTTSGPVMADVKIGHSLPGVGAA